MTSTYKAGRRLDVGAACVGILLFAMCLFAAAGMASTVEPVRVGTVTGVKGEAFVVHLARAEEGADVLSQNSPVFIGDKITTGISSRVKLLMKDDTILTLGQNSEMNLDEYDYQPDINKRATVVKLEGGNLRSLISKVFNGTGSKFEVHTNTAVAGARGTTNIVSVISPEMTLVVGREGISAISNSDPGVEGEVELHAGFGTYVEEGKPPTDPFEVTDDLLGPLEEDTLLSRTPDAVGEDMTSGLEIEPIGGPATTVVNHTGPADLLHEGGGEPAEPVGGHVPPPGGECDHPEY